MWDSQDSRLICSRLNSPGHCFSQAWDPFGAYFRVWKQPWAINIWFLCRYVYTLLLCALLFQTLFSWNSFGLFVPQSLLLLPKTIQQLFLIIWVSYEANKINWWRLSTSLWPRRAQLPKKSLRAQTNLIVLGGFSGYFFVHLVSFFFVLLRGVIYWREFFDYTPETWI